MMACLNLRRLLFLGLGLLLANGAARAAGEADWPHWRGPHDNGSTTEGTYPVKWDTTNLLWKAPLPGKGCSTPVVWDKRIFLTAPSDGQDATLAFDWDGKPLWQTTLGPGEKGKRQNSSGCNPSPATDGKDLFVYFKSGTLASLNFQGKVRWQTNLVAAFGPVNLFWDQGTSPVLTRNAVVIACHRANAPRRFLAGGVRQGHRPIALEDATQLSNGGGRR